MSNPVTKKMLIALSISYIHKSVQAGIGQATEDEQGGWVHDPATVIYTDIRDEWYDELMSAHPTWAPGKPAGWFREEDVFTVIEMMNQETE